MASQKIGMKEKTSYLKDPDVKEIIKKYPPEPKLPSKVKNLKSFRRGANDS